MRDKLDMRDYGERARQQPGFGGTSMAQHQMIPTERTDVEAPSDLGRTNATDYVWASRVGDYAPAPGNHRPHPAGPWRPLWREQWVLDGRRQNRYEWDFLTAHGAVEDVLLHRAQWTRAPPGEPYTVPTERPVPTMSSPHSPLLWI
jgi:hypothetical protein